MKRFAAALAAVTVAATIALVIPFGDGIIIDATSPDAAQAAITVNEGDGGGGAWQPCGQANHHMQIMMVDTIQGVYGYTYYSCNGWAAGGWYVWDYIHGAYFRNLSGVGYIYWTMPSQYTSAWLPSYQWS